MWYAVWGSPHWHRLSSPNPISPLSHQILLFQFAIDLVGPRLSKGDHALGVCLTSLGCVVAVYVVLVLTGGYNLVVIPEMGEEVCEI